MSQPRPVPRPPPSQTGPSAGFARNGAGSSIAQAIPGAPRSTIATLWTLRATTCSALTDTLRLCVPLIASVPIGRATRRTQLRRDADGAVATCALCRRRSRRERQLSVRPEPSQGAVKDPARGDGLAEMNATVSHRPSPRYRRDSDSRQVASAPFGDRRGFSRVYRRRRPTTVGHPGVIVLPATRLANGR